MLARINCCKVGALKLAARAPLVGLIYAWPNDARWRGVSREIRSLYPSSGERPSVYKEVKTEPNRRGW